MARADRKARRAKRKERRANRKARRERRKEVRAERKEQRLEGGTFFERLGSGITGVVGAIEGVKNFNEGIGDPLNMDAGYLVVEDPEFEKTSFDMDTIKKYWWVGAAALALFFFRKRLM